MRRSPIRPPRRPLRTRSTRRKGRRRRFGAGATVGLLVLAACTGRGSAHDARGLSVYRLGTDQNIEVALNPLNRGLGSAPPDRLGIAFTVDELIAFFRPGQVPVSPQLIAILRQEEQAIRNAGECNAYTGDSPISMILRPSRDHDIRASLEHRRRTAEFEFQNDPKTIHGLRNLGRIDYSRTGRFADGDNLELLSAARAPFGMDISCARLESPVEGGCIVRRDLASNLNVEYSFCEDLLPHWREIDNLYFAIAARAVRMPRLGAEYRIGDE